MNAAQWEIIKQSIWMTWGHEHAFEASTCNSATILTASDFEGSWNVIWHYIAYDVHNGSFANFLDIGEFIHKKRKFSCLFFIAAVNSRLEIIISEHIACRYITDGD